MSERELTALDGGAARPGYIELGGVEGGLSGEDTPLSTASLGVSPLSITAPPNAAPLTMVPLSAAVWGDLNLGTQRLSITIGVSLVSATVSRLSRLLLDAVLSSDWPVVLNLRYVSEIDSDGLTLLLKLHKMMPVEVRSLSLLVSPGTQPARILNLSGLERIMAVLTDLDQKK